MLLAFGALTSAGAAGSRAYANAPAGLFQDFEQGTAGGWTTFNCSAAAQVSISDAVYSSGTRSLRLSGRETAGCSPSISAAGLMEAGQTYAISAKVKLGSGAGSMKFTMKESGSTDSYVQVLDPVPASDAGWTTLQGDYSPPAGTSGLMLYVEGAPAGSDVYLDDFMVFKQSTVQRYGFEDGSAQGWTASGSGTASSVAEAAHGGSYSLLSDGRTAAWNGPSADMSYLETGATYRISAWVKQKAGSSSLKMSMKHTPAGGSAGYEGIGSAAIVGDTDWVQLTGVYKPVDPALMFYIESDSATASYYVDDVSVDMLLPAPSAGGNPPSGELPALSAGFEDGTAQGWQGRMGTETLSVVSTEKHGGSSSLLTTGRTATYSGPAIDVTGYMMTGSKYNVSVWMKLASGEPAAQARVSLAVKSGSTTNYRTLVGNTEVTDGPWVRLSGEYTLSEPFDSLVLYVETNAGMSSFYIDDFSLASTTAPPQLPIQRNIPSLHEVLADCFPIGAAIEPSQTAGLHADMLKKHFNSIVAENAMKWDAVEPGEGSFTFDQADKIVDFARANGMLVRGHTLLWHQQVPDWVFKDADGGDMTPTPANKALLLQRLENHIKNVVEHFGDKIYVYDVVNEVIDESQPDGFRRSKWFQILGPEYIDKAFEYARKYAPAGTKLYINDYSTTEATKRKHLYNLVADLKQRGIPVDGVGHQMHINVTGPSGAIIEQTMKMFAGLGVDNQVTELDMSIYANSSDKYTTPPQSALDKQGHQYKEIFEAFKKEKTEGRLTNVTLWGIGDDHTWLSKPERADFPLLFDAQLQAKPAYWGIVDPSKLPALIQTKDVSKGVPVIDGSAETLWRAVSPTPVEAGDASWGASFRTLWDDSHLYLYGEIRDASVNPADKLELYIDGNNGKTPAYQPDDKHYTLTRGQSAAAGIDYRVVEKKDGSGYAIEAAIPLESAAAGKKLGFDIRFTDADSGQALSWNDASHSQDSDTSKYGTVTLAGELKVAGSVRGTPVVDGDEDVAWADAEELETGVWVQGTSGAAARFRTMWDDGHLYVYAHVKDPLLSKKSADAYQQDSVEIFVDPNNGKTPIYEADDGQYRVNFDNERSYNGAASPDNFKTATRIVDDGYVVEAAISLDSIQAKAGDLIGFDLQVNDDQAGLGTRASVVNWSDPSGLSYQNTSKYGVLVLGAADDGSEPSPSPQPSPSASPDPSASPSASPQPSASPSVSPQPSATPSPSPSPDRTPDPAWIPTVLPSPTPSPAVTGSVIAFTAVPDASGTAVLSVSAADLAKAVGSAEGAVVTVKAESGSGLKKIVIQLPVGPLQDAAGRVRSLVLDAGLASVALDASMMPASASGTLELAVALADSGSLTEGARALLAGQPLVSIGLSLNGVAVTDTQGLAAITIPYALKAGSKPSQAVAFQAADNGSLAPAASSRYSAAAGGVTFKPQRFGTYAAALHASGFGDLVRVPWAQDAVAALEARGIVSGMKPGMFAPGADVTRAEFIQMLMNSLSLNGSADGSSSFADAEAGAWYAGALASAQQLGIVSGRPDGTFGVNEAISRQEMAAMLYRAAGKAGIELKGAAGAAAFLDSSSIAGYAAEAVSALRQAGIVQGMEDGRFAPTSSATRAQAAVMIYGLYGFMP